ncbi:hypothetical protein [Methanolapillus millepedarum]|uniref:H/ACA RNA-protein complex protein Gar1 n=1 Tax=Methanolapillus millepedarum TaxID=3028296 RepID=A0AA96VAH7_9EURY|nr:hypothetical protein MsAc7_00180 [Methanosarcinaceae archaeon Ac7]
MKRLGTVTHLHGQSCFVVKYDVIDSNASLYGMLNSQVIDKSVRPIGKVVTVFGSEKQPYFLVRIYRELKTAQIKNLVKEKVYIK